MAQDIYIYVYLPGLAEPVLAGKMTSAHDPVTRMKKALFRYAESYFARADRKPIDPVGLPFKETPSYVYETADKDGQEAFSVMYDSIPDAWGRARMHKSAGRDKMTALEYILASGEDRSGFLAYGLDRDGPSIVAPWSAAHSNSELLDLSAAALIITEDHHVTLDKADAQRILLYGSSLGGARPKVTVRYEDKVWLAKPPKEGDAFHYPRAEYASLTLAKVCGLRTPEVRIVKVNGKDVYLIERFDRHIGNGTLERVGFLSMHAAIGYPRRRMTPQIEGTYIAMAANIASVSNQAGADKKELFGRVVFNALVGNDDDHLRNHAFFETEGGWRLSPLFDVLPLPFKPIAERRLNQGFGALGNLCSIDNLLSRAEEFGLTNANARSFLGEIVDTVRANWERVFRDAGVPGSDMDGFRKTFAIAEVFARDLDQQ